MYIKPFIPENKLYRTRRISFEKHSMLKAKQPAVYEHENRIIFRLSQKKINVV